VPHAAPVMMKRQFINTTVGRAIFNDHLPKEMPFINGLIKKKGVQQLCYYCYLRFGLKRTVQMLDELKELKAWVEDSGEGRWTIKAVIDEAVPAPVLTTALYERFSSRGEAEFANKLLSAMRYQFGGHLEKSDDKSKVA